MRTFQSWHTSVYRVQCHTCDIAKEITGNYSDVTRVNMSQHYHFPPPFCLRLLRAFRTPSDQQFRDTVAAIAWKRRHIS